MTIVRGDKTYELTPDELFSSYQEQERIFDRQDVTTLLEEYVEWGDLKDEILHDGDLIDQMACEMRHTMDKYGCDMEYSREQAIRDWCPDEYRNGVL